MGLMIRHFASQVTGDLTPCDYFFWGCVKDTVVRVPPLSSTASEVKNCITTAVGSTSRDLLQQARNEFDYRLGIVRVTKGARVEHL